MRMIPYSWGKLLWQTYGLLKPFFGISSLLRGLQVNFSKSSVMGVNVGDEFLGLVECFLYSRVGSVLFTYLGLPIGANPRLERTWKPVIQLLASRLGS